MSDTFDDYTKTESGTANAKHRRRQTITTLVRTVVDLSDSLNDSGDISHRNAVNQLTRIIGHMTDRIVQADERTFAAIVTEAAALAQRLQHREAQLAERRCIGISTRLGTAERTADGRGAVDAV